jgi:hypothetical protein
VDPSVAVDWWEADLSVVGPSVVDWSAADWLVADWSAADPLEQAWMWMAADW